MNPSVQPNSTSESMVSLPQDDFEVLLDRAAERGAERVLAHLGLENGHAARDIRELRDLLWAWRDARRTAWQTTVKVITTGILAALLVGAAIKLKLMGGAQ
jgi:hypothetical protein